MYREHLVVVLDRAYTAPLYTQAEAARIVGLPANTLRNWSRGYLYKTTQGPQSSEGLITLAPKHGRLELPFVGLSEAYVISSLKAAGIPMVRIRPAVERLKDEMGLSEALVSERLKTDGVEVLFDYVGEEEESNGGSAGLAVVRNKQLVFREVVEDYLKTIRYSGDGYIESFMPKRFGEGTVFVDPRFNAGQPSFVDGGVRVEDVARRVNAGEPLEDVADDFEIPADIVELVLSRV